MNISLPSSVLHAIRLLNNAGFEAFVVGGCVRDSLMGKQPTDWDITTSALPEQTVAVFADYRTIDTGIQHGTVTVILENTPLEITTYRVDGSYSDGRHPDTVAFTRSLQEDLRRRDFTVNAMAYHPERGLVDPFGGQSDLADGIIRCVGAPSERFSEDALRILRAVRFSSVLGFTIDLDTADALRRLSSTLSRVSVERIATEFKKLLCGAEAVRVMAEHRDVIAVFMPEISNCADFSLLSNARPLPHARLAALFYGADVSATAAESALRRLRLDNQTIREASLLLSVRLQALSREDSCLLRLLNVVGPDLIFDYLDIKSIGKETAQRVQQLLDMKACYQVSMLAVNGDDMIAAGVAPGPAVGATLQALLYAVMEDACPNNKDALLAYMKIWKKPVQ